MHKICQKLSELVESNDFNEESNLSDLGLDSFSIMEFKDWLNSEYGRNFTLEDLRKFSKVGNLIVFLESS